MRLKQLEYVIEVVETGSMTQAAKNLFIAQPSLSKAIRDLEEELNIQLFNRSKKGVSLTSEGDEFLGYAKMIIHQRDLLNQRYKVDKRPKEIFSVAGHHYAFMVDAFVKLLKQFDQDQYQATLKELRTYEVLEEVTTLRSEIGVLYRSKYNQNVINGALKERQLSFTSLYKAKPHVFLDKDHPLAHKQVISLKDLEPFPRMSYEQGTHNSYYFWEEVHADIHTPKQITVSDRATIFNLMIGLKGYTISSGIINEDLNGSNIMAVPLESDEAIELGYLTNDNHRLSQIAEEYLILLKESITTYGHK